MNKSSLFRSINIRNKYKKNIMWNRNMEEKQKSVPQTQTAL